MIESEELINNIESLVHVSITIHLKKEHKYE